MYAHSFEIKSKRQSEEAALRQAGITATMGDVISCLQERLQLLANKTVTTPIGIATALKLSPDSMNKVSQYSSRGIFQSLKLVNAAPTGKRSGFLVNVVKCLRPLITKICEIPKFRDGNTDAAGVCELVLSAMRKGPVSNSRKRKLFAVRLTWSDTAAAQTEENVGGPANP